MGSFFRNFGLFIGGLLVSFILLSPTYRARLSQWMNPDGREILGTLQLKTSTGEFKVVKLLVDQVIRVEIYKVKDDGNFALFASFEIPDSRDVFYDFQSSMTNLFSSNIDDDEDEEVIVPVLDNNLVAHLNVIKYDAQSKNFEHYKF